MWVVKTIDVIEYPSSISGQLFSAGMLTLNKFCEKTDIFQAH